jgi:hypothetical protein
LPESSILGGVNITDASGRISDNIFFYNDGAGNGFMEFTSLPGGGSLADTGVANLGFNGAVENPDCTFAYLAIGNSYHGVSNDVNTTPEPATLSYSASGPRACSPSAAVARRRLSKQT